MSEVRSADKNHHTNVLRIITPMSFYIMAYWCALHAFFGQEISVKEKSNVQSLTKHWAEILNPLTARRQAVTPPPGSSLPAEHTAPSPVMAADALCIVGTKLLGNQGYTDLEICSQIFDSHGVTTRATLFNDEGNPRSTIMEAIATLAAGTASKLSFVYFTGHGMESKAKLGAWVIGPGEPQDEVHMSDVVALPDSMITVDDFLHVWQSAASPGKRCVLLLDCCWSSHWLARWKEEQWPHISVCRVPMSDKKVIEMHVTTNLDKLNAKPSFNACAELMKSLR